MEFPTACLRSLTALAATLALLTSGTSAQRMSTGGLSKGQRVLSLDLTEPASNNFDDVVARAKAVGAEATSLSLFWDDLETSPGSYQPNPNFLAIADLYYPAQGLALNLEINPVDTTQLRLPPDLVGTNWDDPALQARFRSLLDWVATEVPNLRLISLSLGNEVDIFLGNDAAAWAGYTQFFQNAAAHAHTLFPGIPVGVKTTHAALFGPGAALTKALHAGADGVFLTYYPLRPDSTVLPPSVVRRDLERILRRFPNKQIYLLETGYPSGALCNSDEAKQAAFVRAMFRVWDRYRDRIPVIEFVWMHDISPSALQFYEAYYGISDPVFLEYLGTLGLRNYAGSGSDKLGFQALCSEAHLRGW